MDPSLPLRSFPSLANNPPFILFFLLFVFFSSFLFFIIIIIYLAYLDTQTSPSFLLFFFSSSTIVVLLKYIYYIYTVLICGFISTKSFSIHYLRVFLLPPRRPFLLLSSLFLFLIRYTIRLLQKNIF